MPKLKELGKKIACDKDGKLVLFQKPNPPLIGWLLCTGLRFFVPLGGWGDLVGFLGSALLFTWAYLEIVDGTTCLRRLLGAVLLGAIVVSHM